MCLKSSKHVRGQAVITEQSLAEADHVCSCVRVGLRVNIPADDHFGLRERCLRHGIEEASQSPE
jgi:hypothetical protein